MNCKSFEFYKNEIEELEKQYFDSLDEAAKDGALDELCEFIGVNLSKETSEPTHNLKKMLDEVYERYEMLTLLESVNRTWNRKENQVEKIANYITVIDVCNANNSSK